MTTALSPHALQHSPAQTSALVADIREVLHSPEYEQAVQDGLLAAGVPQRLMVPTTSSNSGSPPHSWQQQRQLEPSCTSPYSTITLSPPLNHQQQPGAAAMGNSSMGNDRHLSKQEMSNQLIQQVESLLQRTDSILSRSSGHSTLHSSYAAHPPGLAAVNTAISSPHGLAPLHHELGGFDFEHAESALDTPTLCRPRAAAAAGGSGGIGSIGRGSSRRRTTSTSVADCYGPGMFPPTGALTPPIGSSSGSPGLQFGWSPQGGGFEGAAGTGRGGAALLAGGLTSPSSAEEGDIGTSGGRGGAYARAAWGGGSSAAGSDRDRAAGSGGGGGGGARQLVSAASRLSQQALSEIKDRLEGDAQSRFSSGLSGDNQTACVLDKSASWRGRGGGAGGGGSGQGGGGRGGGGGGGECPASPIYANFAPLEQLVDAALTDLGSATGGGRAGASGAARTGSLTAGGGGGVSPPSQWALSYMLQPDYINTATLARLQSELASVSRPASAHHQPGSSPFDVKLLALTARLSQWSQQERSTAQAFQQLLESILDSVFARLSPSRGRLLPKPALVGLSSPHKSGSKHHQEPPRAPARAPISSGSGKQQLSVQRADSGSGAAASSSSMAAAAAVQAARRMSGSAGAATEAAVVPPAPKPTDSMLRTAFAKLALAQAKLRQPAAAPGSPSSAAVAAVPLAAAAVQTAPIVSQCSSDIGVVGRGWSDTSSRSAGCRLSHADDAALLGAGCQAHASPAVKAAAQQPSGKGPALAALAQQQQQKPLATACAPGGTWPQQQTRPGSSVASVACSQPVLAASSCSAAGPSSSRGAAVTWSQPAPRQPHQQQQDVARWQRPQPGWSSDPPPLEPDAWLMRDRPNTWSPGSSTLALARQTHAQALQQQQQQMHGSLALSCAAQAKDARRSLFRAQQQQQQQHNGCQWQPEQQASTWLQEEDQRPEDVDHACWLQQQQADAGPSPGHGRQQQKQQCGAVPPPAGVGPGQLSCCTSGAGGSVRVGTAGSPCHGSARKLRLPLQGAYLDVFADGSNEVRSAAGSPLRVDVLPLT